MTAEQLDLLAELAAFAADITKGAPAAGVAAATATNSPAAEPGPAPLAAGTAGDGLDEVRQVLARSIVSGTRVDLPDETLPRPVWQATHAMLTGMGAAGGSRRGQPYRFDTDRSAELAAFIAGGPGPKHERVMLGWVRTPDVVAADVIARFADLDALPRPVRALEPSAGDGALVNAVAAAVPDSVWTVVEPVAERARLLGMKATASSSLHRCTFEEYAARRAPDEVFDLIAMNPPYSVPGNRTIWADHVLLAWRMLAEGGRLVAILPGTAGQGRDAKTARLLAEVGPGARFEPLPDRSFRASGTDIAACVLAVTKPAAGADELSLYRPAAGDPVPMAELSLNLRNVSTRPVQSFRGWGGETVVRYVGRCIACHVPTWSDGYNDPRGALGDKAVHPLRASEHGYSGPDVCLCSVCADTGIMYRRGLDKAMTMWMPS